MVMLYQDPEGESVGNFTPSLEASAPNFSMNQSNTDHVERVNLLEKTLQEKEKTISELQHQVKVLKVQVRRSHGGKEGKDISPICTRHLTRFPNCMG